jgi:hypothetical protein
MADLKVVEFTGANLMDVPAQLRATADRIEAGDYEDVDTAYVVIPCDGLPHVIGLGRIDDSANHPITQLSLALHKLCTMVPA